MAKNIIRSARNNRPYTSINNKMLNDRRLSLTARGLLALLISKPPGWEVQIQWIMDEGDIGRNKAYDLLTELIDAGYCERRQLRDGNRNAGIEYVLTDCPSQLVKNREAEVELPGSQLPQSELPQNRDAYKEKIPTKERKLENPLTPKGESETDAVFLNKHGKLVLSEKLRSYWLDRVKDDTWLSLLLEQIETRLHETRNSRIPLEAQVSRHITAALLHKHERDKRYDAAVTRNAKSKSDDDDPFAGRRDH